MSDYLAKIATLPTDVQLAIKEGRGISYSCANMWQTCALQGKFRYVDKLPQVETDALRHGNLFDALTESEFVAMRYPDATAEAVIAQRAGEYFAQLDQALTRVTQMPVYAKLPREFLLPVWVNGEPTLQRRFSPQTCWFYGFLDDVFYRDGKFVTVEDRKFSAKPWKEPFKCPNCAATTQDNRDDFTSDGVMYLYRCRLCGHEYVPADKRRPYHDTQAQCYLWALRQMGIDARELTFKAGNLMVSGIQPFTYKPTMKSIAGIPDWLNEAVDKFTQIPRPTGGHHCGFCSYTKNCDEFLWGT